MHEIDASAFRNDSRRMRLQNDGLALLLYDEGHQPLLARSGATVLEGLGRAVLDDAKSMKLLRQGSLLLVGLLADDDIVVEVSVGEPLSAAETAEGGWQADGPAWLDLPTGVLSLHGYASLPIGRDAAPTAVGGRVDVPMGRYFVRAYRREGEHAHLLVVLTPMPGETPPPAHNVLFGDAIDLQDPARRADRIADGRWSGRIVDRREAGKLAIDFNEDDQRLLGVRAGDRLRVRVDEEEAPVLFWGDRQAAGQWTLVFGPAAQSTLAGEVLAEARFAVGRIAGQAFADTRLEIEFRDAAHPLLAKPEGAGVTVDLGTPYVLAVPPATISKGVAMAVVVGSTVHGMLLGLDASALRKLKARPGDRLEVQAGEVRIEAEHRPRERPSLQAPIPVPVNLAGPAWRLLDALGVPGEGCLAVHADLNLRHLPADAQGAHGLPILAPGSTVTVRRIAPG